MAKSEHVNAGPTKRFFVEMLTRDIELGDAILDLLDNCVDGIVRDLKRNGIDKNADGTPYDGYWATITANPDGFEIWDNCGGIEEKIAINSAFMFGRPDLERDSDIETVGMYGIGMKRAIFKIGKNSTVISHPVGEEAYEVSIPPDWLDDDVDEDGNFVQDEDTWSLELTDTAETLEENGTKLQIHMLHPAIAKQFDDRSSSFLIKLRKTISQHYALIIEKGFEVSVNGKKISPVALTLLSPKNIGATTGPAIEPYLLVGKFGDVDVQLYCGFYRPLVTEKELNDEKIVSSSRDNAGWTVVCNDRIVLYNDKTHRTGWGTKGLTPGYHNQFISIAGVVVFRSNNSNELPLNTTKRGLDSDSELYNMVLDYMREALRKFTSFTNHWKKRESESRAAFKSLSKRRTLELSKSVNPDKLSNVNRLKGRNSAKRYSPNLPKPKKKTTKKQVRISFVVDKKDYSMVEEYYYDGEDVSAPDVGLRCFNESLHRAKGASR